MVLFNQKEKNSVQHFLMGHCHGLNDLWFSCKLHVTEVM